MTQTITLDEVKVTLFRSEIDGVICVQIDTPVADRSPQIRVYVNDEDTYVGVDHPDAEPETDDDDALPDIRVYLNDDGSPELRVYTNDGATYMVFNFRD